MHAFNYDYIKNKYDNKSKLLFTDIDSLVYEIKTEDFYKDFCSNKEIFHFINYSTKSILWQFKQISYWKNERWTWGVAIEEFVGLKQKMYSFLEDNGEHKKAKGVVATISQYDKYKDVNVKM